MDMLFHITDDDAYGRAFANLARMLRPGGLLVFTENFVHGPAGPDAHQVSRPLEEIEALVRAAGLEPLWRRPAFVLMNGPVDSDSRLLAAAWAATTRALRAGPGAGRGAGRAARAAGASADLRAAGGAVDGDDGRAPARGLRARSRARRGAARPTRRPASSSASA